MGSTPAITALVAAVTASRDNLAWRTPLLAPCAQPAGEFPCCGDHFLASRVAALFREHTLSRVGARFCPGFNTFRLVGPVCHSCLGRSWSWCVGAVGRYQWEQSKDDCILCPVGQFGNVAGLGYCNGTCLAGYACPLGTAIPGDCPPGTFGAADKTACVPCPVGRWGPVGSVCGKDDDRSSERVEQ